MITITGHVKSDPGRVGGDTIVFLAPWTRDGAELATPVRVQVPGVVDERIRKGARVRITCATLEAGAPWWTARAESAPAIEDDAPAPHAAEVELRDGVHITRGDLPERRAEEILAILLERRAALTRAVAARMANLYNDTWRDAGPRLTIAQIAARLRLAAIRVDVAPLVYFDDGDLFAGHSIEVFLDEQLDVSDATLAG